MKRVRHKPAHRILRFCNHGCSVQSALSHRCANLCNSAFVLCAHNVLTKKLDKMLAKYPKNGRKDGYIGFGLGCIYAVAKEVRQ